MCTLTIWSYSVLVVPYILVRYSVLEMQLNVFGILPFGHGPKPNSSLHPI